MSENSRRGLNGSKREFPDYHQRLRCSGCSFQMANGGQCVVTPETNPQINQCDQRLRIAYATCLPSRAGYAGFAIAALKPRGEIGATSRFPCWRPDAGEPAQTRTAFA